MPRRRRDAVKKTPEHRYRKYGSVKGATRQLTVWVPEWVFNFFDAHAIDQCGQVRSRAETLQAIVQKIQMQEARTVRDENLRADNRNDGNISTIT